MKLSKLKKGKKAIIINIEGSNDFKIRLYNIGLIEDTIIKNILTSPSKKISAYSFRNTLVALRDIDATNIEIEELYE